MNKYSRKELWRTARIVSVVYVLFIAVMILLIIALFSSCSPKIIRETVTNTVVERHDSLIYKDTTIFVPIPAESQSNVVLPKDTSKVETSFAESKAWIDTTGLLHHTIQNKRRDWGVQIKYPERTIVSKATTTSHDKIIVEKKVEKELNWWQKFRLWMFFPLLAIVIYSYKDIIIPFVKKIVPLIKKLLV